MMDKVKFWKHENDFGGDLDNLDDFSLDDHQTSSPSSNIPSSIDSMNTPNNMPQNIPHDADPAAMHNLQPLTDENIPGMQTGVPTMRESLEPSTESVNIGNDLGISPNPNQQINNQEYPGQTNFSGQKNQQQNHNLSAQEPYSSAQESHFSTQNNISSPQTNISHSETVNLSKEFEIINAKIDAIRSSLESINQRLATLERMGQADNQKKYSW